MLVIAHTARGLTDGQRSDATARERRVAAANREEMRAKSTEWRVAVANREEMRPSTSGWP